jgi:hypothetical protein
MVKPAFLASLIDTGFVILGTAKLVRILRTGRRQRGQWVNGSRSIGRLRSKPLRQRKQASSVFSAMYEYVGKIGSNLIETRYRLNGMNLI